MERLCPFCEEYAGSGHNYCRMCGSRLTLDHERRTEVRTSIEPAEKYCGHCGRQLSECSGGHEI